VVSRHLNRLHCKPELRAYAPFRSRLNISSSFPSVSGPNRVVGWHACKNGWPRKHSRREMGGWLAETRGWLAKFERSAGNATEASAGEMGEVCWQR